MERKEFSIKWMFTFGDDSIDYKRDIECTDLDCVIDYVISWVEKFGYKYGECDRCVIRQNHSVVAIVEFFNAITVKYLT